MAMTMRWVLLLCSVTLSFEGQGLLHAPSASLIGMAGMGPRKGAYGSPAAGEWLAGGSGDVGGDAWGRRHRIISGRGRQGAAGDSGMAAQLLRHAYVGSASIRGGGEGGDGGMGGEKAGGGGALSIEVRLGDLEEMRDSGLLTQQEFELEKERLLQACARAGTDVDKIYSHKEEWEDYVDAENYTIARRANNNLARSMAYGEPEVNDMSARGVRLHGAIDFSDEEFARMRRGGRREELETEAGLEAGDLRDMRSTWCDAAHSLYKELCEAAPEGKPLTEVSFKARRDLAAGEVVSLSARNYTRRVDAPWTPETDAVELSVDSSPFGKITRAVWGQRLRMLNLTVAQPVFQDEPIRVLFNETSGIYQDLSSEDMTMSGFMELLFSRKLSSLSKDTHKDATAASLPTTGPAFQPHDELVVCGLKGSPELNGKRVRVVSRTEERCKVQVIDTGRKVLLRDENLERAESDAASGTVRHTENLMGRLYASGNETGEMSAEKSTAGGSAEGSQWEQDNKGERLSDQDILDLQALNISAEAGQASWQTRHYDGGLGRYVVTPFTDDDDLFVSNYVKGKRSKQRLPAASKQLLLDYYLQLAAMEGDADRVEALLQAGANMTTTRFPGTYHGDNDRTPVHVATYETKVDAVKALLYHGADANARDGNLATPLHLAAIKGDTELVQVLLDAGGDPTLLNYWNRSCIHRAVFYGRQEAQEMMMDAAGDRVDMDEIREIARLEGMDESVAQKWAYLD